MQILEILAACAGLVASIFSVLKWTAIPIRRIADLCKKIDYIFEQIQPNGGTSLLDKINRLSGEIERMVGRHWALVSKPAWECNSEGECIRANLALSQLLGVPFDLIRGVGWYNSVVEEDRARVSKEWSQAISDERAFYSCYSVRNILTGRVQSVQAQAYPLLNESGQLLGWVGWYESEDDAIK